MLPFHIRLTKRVILLDRCETLFGELLSLSRDYRDAQKTSDRESIWVVRERIQAVAQEIRGVRKHFNAYQRNNGILTPLMDDCEYVLGRMRSTRDIRLVILYTPDVIRDTHQELLAYLRIHRNAHAYGSTKETQCPRL